MILHLSRALAKRLKCDLSFKESKVAQTGREDSWSADIFRIPRAGTHALIMHDASLWPLIMDLRVYKTYESFLQHLLLHIEASYMMANGDFDGANITVVATKRSNRSIIGSMNNAIYLIESYVEQAMTVDNEIDWLDVQSHLANTPFMSLPDHFPAKAFINTVGRPL
jgi:hypothetical protein